MGREKDSSWAVEKETGGRVGQTVGTRGGREHKITDGEHSGSLYTLNCCSTTTFSEARIQKGTGRRGKQESAETIVALKKPLSTTCSACAA